jgi:hypothetical protein
MRRYVRHRMLRTQGLEQQDRTSGAAGHIPREADRCMPVAIRLLLWVGGVVGIALMGALILPPLGLSSVATVTDANNRGLQSPSSSNSAIQLGPNNAVSAPDNGKEAHRKRQAAACRQMKSDRVIRACYPAKYVKQFEEPECNVIDEWEDVQRCLTGRFQYDVNKPIKEIHIVGERNSGTKFVTKAVQQCFPKSAGIKVHRDFVRGKHFFQPIVMGDFSSSLVIVVVRDPVEWMAAMREFPYHSPSHIAGFDNMTGAVVPLPWQDFVSKPWTTVHTKEDRKLAQNRENLKQPICREHYNMRHVVPCRSDNITAQGPPWNIPENKWRGYEPIYELRRDGSGKPFDDILQLRSDKIVNWVLQMPLILQIGGFMVVRYEDLLKYGNEFLLQQVADILATNDDAKGAALPANCEITGPQPARIGKRKIPDDFRDWINQNVDVERERLLGYR